MGDGNEGYSGYDTYSDHVMASQYDNYRLPSEIKAAERVASLSKAFAATLRYEVDKAEVRGYEKGLMDAARLMRKARA
jgi:hypothetical protein